MLNIKHYLKLYESSRKAMDYARSSGRFIGEEFANYGKSLGRKLIFKGSRGGVEYLLTPVNIFRYFEFPFVYSAIPHGPIHCLDVSSPRLFSLYYAEKTPDSSIRMINPDSLDFGATETILSRIGIKNMELENIDLEAIGHEARKYDCIWAISVIEHISGKYDDRHAIRLMYDALERGGRLILTFPVDRVFRDEFRKCNAYGLEVDRSNDSYFFQRYYDYPAIVSRLISSIGIDPIMVKWFGEKKAGHYVRYESQWLERGYECTVNDPIEIVDHYTEYASWDEMPGLGICGLVFEKT